MKKPGISECRASCFSVNTKKRAAIDGQYQQDDSNRREWITTYISVHNHPSDAYDQEHFSRESKNVASSPLENGFRSQSKLTASPPSGPERSVDVPQAAVM